MYASEPAEAKPQFRFVTALDRFLPPMVWGALGRALFAADRLAEVLPKRYCADRQPDYTFCLQTLAAAAEEVGHRAAARAAVAALLRAPSRLRCRRQQPVLPRLAFERALPSGLPRQRYARSLRPVFPAVRNADDF